MSKDVWEEQNRKIAELERQLAKSLGSLKVANAGKKENLTCCLKLEFKLAEVTRQRDEFARDAGLYRRLRAEKLKVDAVIDAAIKESKS